ncbi:Uncharacterised protein [Acinetobacter baumannii]|nr:Uncharacterised protein [Acinetobacter baumannii]
MMLNVTLMITHKPFMQLVKRLMVKAYMMALVSQLSFQLYIHVTNVRKLNVFTKNSTAKYLNSLV